MLNGLDPDQAQQNIRPELCPDCLQMLSAGKELIKSVCTKSNGIDFQN